jgi:carbonic anhydrase
MVAQSLDNLMTFPFIRKRVESGELQLHGAHFGIERGELYLRDPETGAFKPATDTDGKPVRPSALINCNEA